MNLPRVYTFGATFGSKLASNTHGSIEVEHWRLPDSYSAIFPTVEKPTCFVSQILQECW